MKLRHEALVELNRQVVEAFGHHFALRRWHGFRLLAVDGSTARLPKETEIAKVFGGPSDAHCPMARFSRLYDVLNKLVVYADMEPYATGERELAASYLYKTMADDLTLYDRGYGAFWLFSMHRDMERAYCARLPVAYSKEVTAFLASGQPSETVLFSPSAQAKSQCEAYNLSAEPVPVRLVRVELDDGAVEVLATSLLDQRTYPSQGFAKLYSLRWGVEENYKREKVRLEIENFSSCSVLTIRQDFHAKIIALNLAAMLEWVAQAIADRVYAQRQHRYQINFANALSVLKNNLIRWLAKGMPWDMLLRLLTEIVGAVEAVIPGRSFPRNKRAAKAREFHGNYKRTA